jgi:hypothetical protein
MQSIWIKIISVLEVIGGLGGLSFLIWWFLFTPFDVYSLLLVLILITLHFLSILGGIGLWRGKPYGRLISIIIQIVQIPKLTSPFFIFIFSYGFDFWIQFLLFPNGYTHLGIQLKFLFFSQLSFDLKDAPIGLGVSITSIIFLIMLFKYKSEITEKETIDEPPLPPTFESNSV